MGGEAWGGGGAREGGKGEGGGKDAAFFGLLKNNNLAGDEVAREGGQGGRWGGASESNKGCTGLIWLVTRGVGWGEAWGGGGPGSEVCDCCQCSHMSNTPMHDVHMLKVLVWTQLHYSASAVKETPDRLAVCTVVRAVTHRLHLNVVAELLGVLPGRLCFDRGIRKPRECPSATEIDRRSKTLGEIQRP